MELRGYEKEQMVSAETKKKKSWLLLLHGSALVSLSGEGGSRGSNSGKMLGVVETDQLDAVQGVEIAVPCSEDLDVLWAREIGNF